MHVWPRELLTLLHEGHLMHLREIAVQNYKLAKHSV